MAGVVLLVERNPDVAEVIRLLLEQLGATVRVAPTVRCAAREIGQTPALVLLDTGTRGSRIFIRMLNADPTTASSRLSLRHQRGGRRAPRR